MQPNEDERQLLALIADYNKRSQAAQKAGESEVGVFFVYNGEVLKQGTPFSVDGLHGLFKSKNNDHDHFWKSLQRFSILPRGVAYDEVPHGRVDYDINEKRFHVYADPCILKDGKALDEIYRQFHLPSTNTDEPEHDPRYKCKMCGDYQQRDS
jgi:hypothetical protein